MEGPSLIILKDELQQFLGKKVLKVTGNTKQPKEQLKSRKLEKIETWGKVLFLIFTAKNKNPIVIKTHFLMFGSYRISKPKENREPRLEIKFSNGILYLYSCSIRFDGQEYLSTVDKEVDLLSPTWSEKHVIELMKKKKNSYLCDLFLDQSVFAGSGNIVKNEVLFNIRKYPLTRLSQIKIADWPKLTGAIRSYCFHFYEWKKKFELMQHWQVYRQHLCPICDRKLVKASMGKWERRIFTAPIAKELNQR